MARPTLEQKWLEQNPLRKHIDARGPRSVSEVALQLGISRQTLYLWMDGEATPRIESFGIVTRVTGITLEQWSNWLEDRPQRRTIHVG